MTAIQEKEEILLYLDRRRTYKVRVERGKEFHTHRGFIELGELIGKQYGVMVTSSLGESFFALKPLVRDHVMKTDRQTQVLYPKDISYILFQLGIGSGSRVVEAGTGSGALTMSLANTVRPGGVVYSYEINPRFQRIASGNIERAGLSDYVELKLGDIKEGIEEEALDAIVLDMATPWMVISHAWDSLEGGGIYMSFSPTIEQVMKTVYELRDHPFVDIETVELMLRRITVAENRTRPQTRMIGHTGYLTSARKVIP